MKPPAVRLKPDATWRFYATGGVAPLRLGAGREGSTPIGDDAVAQTTAAYISAENATKAMHVPQSGRRPRHSQLAYPYTSST